MGEEYGEQMILLTRNFPPLGEACPEKKGRLRRGETHHLGNPRHYPPYHPPRRSHLPSRRAGRNPPSNHRR